MYEETVFHGNNTHGWFGVNISAKWLPGKTNVVDFCFVWLEVSRIPYFNSEHFMFSVLIQ